jgi:multidrug resistance efflux pump
MMKINFDENRQHHPQREKEMKVPYAPAKRKTARFRWYLILLIVSSPLLYFLGKMLYLLFIVNAPGYVSLEKVPVNASVAGVVAKVAVKPGEMVQQGDPLIILNDLRLDQRERVLQAELQTLNISSSPASFSSESVLRDRIDITKKMVDYQQQRLEQFRYLFQQGAATRAELDDAKSRYDQARLTYGQAVLQFSEWQDKTKKEISTPSVHTRVRDAQIAAELSTIQTQREALSYYSTHKFKVLDVFVQEGEALSPGSNMLLLGDLEHTVITCYLDPRYIRYSRVGTRATLKFPDGSRGSATVVKDTNLAKRLPGDLASPIGNRDLQLVVQLVPDQPLPPKYLIDGLPLSVRFHGDGTFFNQKQ